MNWNRPQSKKSRGVNWNRPQSKKSRGVNWNRPQSKKSRGVNWNQRSQIVYPDDRAIIAETENTEKMSANRTSSRDGGDSHHLPRDVSGNGRSLRRTSSTSQNRVRGRPAKAPTRSISNTGTSTAVTNRDDELEPDAEEEDDQPRTTQKDSQDEGTRMKGSTWLRQRSTTRGGPSSSARTRLY